jgi:bifunctional non-homologous end joining protein LigD
MPPTKKKKTTPKKKAPAASLRLYKQKRSFDRTPEPSGGLPVRGKPLRFCVQKHAASHLHYDFRLEVDGVLKSWAVPKGPSLDPTVRRLAMQVEDHPWDYRTFEGIIPAGQYGGGTVMLWDEGTYTVPGTASREEAEAAMRQGLAKGHVKFELQGSKLKGGWSLLRMPPRDNDRGKASWLLVKKQDDFSGDEDVTRLDASVSSGRSMEGIAQGLKKKLKIWISKEVAGARVMTPATVQPPKDVKPMLCTLVEEVEDRDGWYYEPKLDGYRAIAETGGKPLLYSRNLKSFNAHYPPLVEALGRLKHRAVLDGEVVCLDKNGQPDFQGLQDWREAQRGVLRYYVFDLLYLDGRDLREQPLRERKAVLDELQLPGPEVQPCLYVRDKGSEFFKQLRKQGMEGMVAKDGDSPYREGQRGLEWLKLKFHLQQEAVIGGWTEPRGSRQGLGALILGIYKGKDLVYVGHTGGGFNEALLKSTIQKLRPLETARCPFKEKPVTNAPAHWVKPELSCQVKFQAWTSDGRMRIPIFQGLRMDKPAKEIGQELPQAPSGRYFGPGPAKRGGETVRIGGRDLALTHLNKTYFPDDGLTKGDVIDYDRKMAKWMLPYLKDRPQSLRRNPDGLAGGSFFHKDFDIKPYAWMKTVHVKSETRDDMDYLVCNDEATLVAMANLGCIEINPWNSRTGSLDNPDYCIVDLDPEDIAFSRVIETAMETRKVLETAKITAFCKTTGSRGLHIVIPLGAKYSYDQARMLAELIGQLVHARLPETTSLVRSPSQRQQRVYLDYLQNSRGQTLAAPYCLRPKKGATASAPLDWREVKPGLDPADFNIHTMEARVKKVGDLWKGVLGPGIDLEKALGNLMKLAQKENLEPKKAGPAKKSKTKKASKKSAAAKRAR